MPIVAALILFAIPAAMTFRWYHLIAAYRIDIPAGASPARGGSRYWLLNVVRSANYNSEGQRMLRWFWFWGVTWQVAILVDVIILAIAYT